MNTDLTARRDELKREIAGLTESNRELAFDIVATNYMLSKEALRAKQDELYALKCKKESELTEIESSLARPEPKYEVGQEVSIVVVGIETLPITHKRFVSGEWQYSRNEGGSWWKESRLVPAPIPVTDEAEREFLLDMKAARELGEGYKSIADHPRSLFDALWGRHIYGDFESRLESKRPGALERLRLAALFSPKSGSYGPQRRSWRTL